MAISKVVYAGETLVDLTSDTVTAENLAQGVTAHRADGTSVTVTAASYVTGEVLTVAFGTIDGEVLHA